MLGCNQRCFTSERVWRTSWPPLFATSNEPQLSHARVRSAWHMGTIHIGGGGENGRPNQCQILQIFLHQYLYLCSRLTVLKSVQCLNVPAFPFSTSSIFSSQVADYETFLRQFWSASENSPMAPSRDAPTPYIPSLNLRTIPMGFVHFLDLFQSLPS